MGRPTIGTSIRHSDELRWTGLLQDERGESGRPGHSVGTPGRRPLQTVITYHPVALAASSAVAAERRRTGGLQRGGQARRTVIEWSTGMGGELVIWCPPSSVLCR